MKKVFHIRILILLFLLLSCSAPAYNQDWEYYGNIRHDLSSLEWQLWGYSPENWKWDFNFNEIKGPKAEYGPVKASVPGSVQKALLEAGIIKDWNIGAGNNPVEWIENRHWIYITRIPDEWLKKDNSFILDCKGLDHNGVIIVNGKEAGQFNNTFIPHLFDVTSFLKEKNNSLAIVFRSNPEYLGQITYTSKIRDWKPRFYYGWDWIPRLVQTGIWDGIYLDMHSKNSSLIENLIVTTSASVSKDAGTLNISAEMNPEALKGNVRIKLDREGGATLLDETIPAAVLKNGKTWPDLKIKRWWPNGSGDQPLYTLTCTLTDKDGNICQSVVRTIGFRNISWLPTAGAPAGADPWICSVNDRPVFLQGVNWTPIRPNFADLTEADYVKLLTTYKELGINVLRIWGGGFPEKEWLYNTCDRLGIMLWQEFPLSSSGIDNYPPVTAEEIFAMSKISESYIRRLRHHPSILMWCGGNELYEMGDTAPVTDKHPMIRIMKEMVKAEDPGRRFVTGSPSGPSISAGFHNYGKGVNWDVHGPWKLPFTSTDKTMDAVRKYWEADDAMMHSEVGVAGAMSAEMINKYRGELPALPANMHNPLWRKVSWWIEWDEYLSDHNGKAPGSLEEYVKWSQERQTTGLAIALKENKSRFPECGGFIIWMGHDCYPCPVNTSIIDFEGNPKPAALELSKIWKEPVIYPDQKNKKPN